MADDSHVKIYTVPATVLARTCSYVLLRTCTSSPVKFFANEKARLSCTVRVDDFKINFIRLFPTIRVRAHAIIISAPMKASQRMNIFVATLLHFLFIFSAGTLLLSVNMISTIAWVPAGVADPSPKRYEMNATELELLRMMQSEKTLAKQQQSTLRRRHHDGMASRRPT